MQIYCFRTYLEKVAAWEENNFYLRLFAQANNFKAGHRTVLILSPLIPYEQQKVGGYYGYG